MLQKMKQRGFTLIELLVVVAIIGILAAVVLASLNDARQSGEDARTKQQLSGMRGEAEISYNQNSFTYDSVCPDVADMAAGVPNFSCEDDDDDWVATGELNDGSFWCVDSSGASATTSNSVNTSTGDVELCDTL